ncbi:MAG: PA0069 family radical SAM protein [Candidatus Latescibacterota bacterium]|nr:PA0069 family radical SAM protein [Candidatus Latescibacterota bacterium]
MQSKDHYDDDASREGSPRILPPKPKGRGAAINTPNRYEHVHVEPDAFEPGDENFRDREPTQYFHDTTKTLLASNDSPDVGFIYSINPYRGCEHGCIYCYARPSHEYLGFSAGVDFETRILVKHDAPERLEEELRKKSWVPQLIALSGNTDCYQPVERKLEITRRCLEVLLKFRNPVTIITKNHLVTRDVDILSELAALDLVHVTMSITSLKHELTATMEPRTSQPELRLKALETLNRNNIPCGVSVAPLIPGLNDEEIHAILDAASKHGAKWAGYIMVRLPHAVKPLFLEWLHRHFPDRVKKVQSRLRAVHNGKLSDPRFDSRMRGEGEVANLISDFFAISQRRCGLGDRHYELDTTRFRRHGHQQLELFT